MNDLEKLSILIGDEKVQEGLDLPKIYLHKWLTLGQTKYVCEYGTLSDGHEKITAAQRYAQAIKEQYYLCQNISGQKALALEAQADILDSEATLDTAKTPQDTLRAQAKKLNAQARLSSALVTVEDQMRMLEVYVRIRNELGPIVEAQYPEGIEQAEEDNWIAVAEYRHAKDKTPGLAREIMSNLPLPPKLKAALGVVMGRPDMAAPLMVTKKKDISMLPSQTINEYLGLPFDQPETK